MQRVEPSQVPEPDFVRPPTQDELPYDDGEPMETWRHVLQMELLLEPLLLAWKDRDDFFAGGNMFVYYSPHQLLNEDFKGPDVFVTLGVPRFGRERKSWLVWEEGKAPDVVIELLSASTARRDRGENKQIYQHRLRVPEYFLFDPWTAELEGFGLHEGRYEPIMPDATGRMPSRALGLTLVRWDGTFRGETARWLRWATPDGTLLPTGEEAADEQHRRAENEHQRAEAERRRADDAQRRLAELEARLARYERDSPPDAP